MGLDFLNTSNYKMRNRFSSKFDQTNIRTFIKVNIKPMGLNVAQKYCKIPFWKVFFSVQRDPACHFGNQSPSFAGFQRPCTTSTFHSVQHISTCHCSNAKVAAD